MPAACTLEAKIIPNAPRNEVTGWMGAALKVKIHAPALDGRANDALAVFLGTARPLAPLCPARARRPVAAQDRADRRPDRRPGQAPPRRLNHLAGLHAADQAWARFDPCDPWSRNPGISGLFAANRDYLLVHAQHLRPAPPWRGSPHPGTRGALRAARPQESRRAHEQVHA